MFGNRRNSIFLFSGALLLLISTSAIKIFTAGHNLSTLSNFQDFFQQFFQVISLTLLILVTWLSMRTKGIEKTQSSNLFVTIWEISFLAIILSVLALSIYVNPHARFSGERFPFVTPGARLIKTKLYRAMEYPDIVILGSSRAFTLSPQYINERMGFEAFNMSVEGGRAGDFLVQLRYMLKLGRAPRVLLVDVSQESLGNNFLNSDLQPLVLLPFMPPASAFQVVDISLRDSFSLSSVEDSIYLLFSNQSSRQVTWTFDEYGWGHRKQLTEKEYSALLKNTIKQRRNSMYCRDLNSEAKGILEEFLSLALANNVGVVLYESPIHSEFYATAYENNSELFERCREILRTYLETLTQNYPNVYFQDLSGFKPINNLDKNGFYDAVHLRPEAANMVIDLLAPEVSSAIQWSLGNSGNRTKP